MPNIWVVVAARFELPIVPQISIKEVGIGLLPSMSGLSFLLASQPKPDAIVLAGTGGCNRPIKEENLPLKPVLTRRFCYPHYRFEETPEIIKPIIEPAAFDPLEPWVDPATVAYSSFGVTKDTSVYDFAKSPIQKLMNQQAVFIENLEALGLAHLCTEHKIPFYALLSVTNQLGEMGRTQWKKFHTPAGGLLAKRLSEVLGQLNS